MGRAPIAPTRRLRKPLTTRQTPANHCRSLANSGESGLSVCSVVSEYGMPYCLRLLQADILPQKLSRRNAMVILLGSSGVAWISTGTCRSARRKASAMARSSPKFGRVTMMPSMRSRLLLEEVGAAPGFFPGFDRAVLALFRSERHHVHAGSGQHAQHFLAAALGQMIGEKSAVAHDQAHRHFFRRHTLALMKGLSP